MVSPLVQGLQQTLGALGYTQMAIMSGPQADQQAFVLLHNPGDIKSDIKELPIDGWIKVSGDANYEASSAILRMAGLPDTQETHDSYQTASRRLNFPAGWGRIDAHRHGDSTILSVTVNAERPFQHLKSALVAALTKAEFFHLQNVAWTLSAEGIGISPVVAARTLLETIEDGWQFDRSTPPLHILRLYKESALFAGLKVLFDQKTNDI